MMHANIEYRTTVEDEHWRNEEFQWARILAQGHPARGMVLLYLQKACTAFHEFEPTFKAGPERTGRRFPRMGLKAAVLSVAPSALPGTRERVVGGDIGLEQARIDLGIPAEVIQADGNRCDDSCRSSRLCNSIPHDRLSNETEHVSLSP